jgi:hypothetical protein
LSEETQIVALGGNARKWLEKNGFGHFYVSHPQYHKRFKNKDRYELIDVLRKLLA